VARRRHRRLVSTQTNPFDNVSVTMLQPKLRKSHLCTGANKNNGKCKFTWGTSNKLSSCRCRCGIRLRTSAAPVRRDKGADTGGIAAQRGYLESDPDQVRRANYTWTEVFGLSLSARKKGANIPSPPAGQRS
jgi:hypothetical protein